MKQAIDIAASAACRQEIGSFREERPQFGGCGWQERKDRRGLAKVAKHAEPEPVPDLITLATRVDGAPRRNRRGLQAILIAQHLEGDSSMYSVANVDGCKG